MPSFPANALGSGNGLLHHASMYVHGASGDWTANDGAIGWLGSDAEPSFSGFDLDDAGGSGGAYDRPAYLALNYRLGLSQKATTTAKFPNISSSAHAFGVGVRLSTTETSEWTDADTDADSGIPYWEGLYAGYTLTLASGGGLTLLGWNLDGSSLTIATGSVAVLAATNYALALEVSSNTDETTVSLTASVDGVTVFGGVQTDTSSDRTLTAGLTSLLLNNRDRNGDSGNQPRLVNFKTETDKGAGLETVLDDDFVRGDKDLLPTHTPPAGAITDASAPLANHLWEWGGNRHYEISGAGVGPFATVAGKQWGQRAVGIADGNTHPFLDLYQIAPASVDHRAEALFRVSQGTDTLFGEQSIGVAVRGSKSSDDGGTPYGTTNFSGYLFRVTLGGAGSGMYLERYNAGAATILAKATPLQAGFFPDDIVQSVVLEASGTGGTVTLTARLGDMGVLSATDTSASRIVTKGLAGIYVLWTANHQTAPVTILSSFQTRSPSSRLFADASTTQQETTTGSAISSQPIFVEASTNVYQVQSLSTERGFNKSRLRFTDSRILWTADWDVSLGSASALFLDFQAMVAGDEYRTIEMTDGSKNFILLDDGYTYSFSAGNRVTVQGVNLIEVI